jgi:hypothetical protein
MGGVYQGIGKKFQGRESKSDQAIGKALEAAANQHDRARGILPPQAEPVNNSMSPTSGYQSASGRRASFGSRRRARLLGTGTDLES